MIMTKFDRSNCFPVILNGYLLLVFLADFQKSHINERLKQYLAFHLIYSDWKFDSESILAYDLDYLRLIFELLAFIFYFSGGR